MTIISKKKFITMKKKILGLATALLILTVARAQKPAVFSTEEGAIRGYDAVAYFTEGKEVKGGNGHTYEWRGATWKFASKAHLDSFVASPEKYAPQYGGYCAFGLSNGYKAPTSPDAWTIKNGKLYLNYNQAVRTEWLKAAVKRIEDADKNWAKMENQ